MRGRMNRRDNGWCGQKRAMLRLALLVATPFVAAPSIATLAMADSPKETNLLLLPPLPLDGTAAASFDAQQINPFCQPAPVIDSSAGRGPKLGQPSLGVPRAVTDPMIIVSEPNVQLASGNTVEPKSAQRRESDRTTVRLVPTNVELGAEAIGTVRNNPIITKKASTIVPNESTVKKVAHDDEKVHSNKSVSKANSQEGPVSFSLDDSQLVDTSGRPAKTSQEQKSLASLLRNTDASDTVVQHVAAPQKTPLYRSVTITEPPATSNHLATITRGSKANRTLLVPIPSADELMPISTPSYPEPKPVVSGPIPTAVISNSDARIVKGSRPRVDVGLPSVAIARTSESAAGSIAPVAKYSSLVTATSPSDAAFESSSPIDYQLQRTEVRSLKTTGEIRKVQLGDSAVCSAIAGGSMQLQLIGTRDGVTRMAVWTATPDGKEEKTVYQIRVGTPVTNGASDPANIAAMLSKSTKAAFPESDLRVRYDKGQMIVEGSCESDESAKKALRMIRSACLLPVDDKIVIR